MDAMFIHAHSSIKNQAGQRDPKMLWTKKGNRSYVRLRRRPVCTGPVEATSFQRVWCAQLADRHVPLPRCPYQIPVQRSPSSTLTAKVWFDSANLIQKVVNLSEDSA